jgi:hypothetical protein
VTTATCGSTILTGRPLRTHGKGRVCDHNGCDTRLNTYNPSRYCYQHEGIHRAKFDMESLLFPTKHCPTCERDLPASSDFWRRDPDEECGWSSQCAKCRNDAQARGRSAA